MSDEESQDDGLPSPENEEDLSPPSPDVGDSETRDQSTELEHAFNQDRTDEEDDDQPEDDTNQPDQKQDNTASELDDLRRQVENLMTYMKAESQEKSMMNARLMIQEREISQLKNAPIVRPAPIDPSENPRPTPFLAKKGGTVLQWAERAVSSGASAAFSGGRACTSDTAFNKAISLATDEFALLEYYDAVSNCFRYVKIGEKGADGTANLFTARIATIVGSSPQRSYTFVEITDGGGGYNAWTDTTSGRTGTCYNLIEDQNATSTPYGNGTDPANYVGTFDIQPAPVGTRVLIFVAPVTGKYWFMYESGVDGTCTTSSDGGSA